MSSPADDCNCEQALALKDRVVRLEAACRTVLACLDVLPYSADRRFACDLIDQLLREMTVIAKHSTAERDALRVERDDLCRVASAFTETAEQAVHVHDHRNDGGMRVPYHGDFAGAQPSVITRLRWWAREFRAVLGGKPWGES